MADRAFEIPGEPPGTGDQRGWHRPRIDAVAWFQKVQRRAPNGAERQVLKRLVDAARAARNGGLEENLEGAILRLGFFAQNLREARGAEVERINVEVRRVIGSKRDVYAAAHPSFSKVVGGALASGLEFAGKAAGAVANPLQFIPGKIGELARMAPDPGELLKLTGGVVRGENVANLASRLGAALSNVPGLGTVAGAGIAGLVAIGKGQALSDIGLSIARGALPGGDAGRLAFDLAVGLAKGGRVDDVALAAIRNQIPEGAAREAFNAATRIAHGENVLKVGASLAPTIAANLAPGALGKLGRATGLDRTAAVLQRQGGALVAQGRALVPGAPDLLRRGLTLIPPGPAQAAARAGFAEGARFAGRFASPAAPAALAKARAALEPAVRPHFDAAVALVARSPELAGRAIAAAPAIGRAVLAGRSAQAATPDVHALIVARQRRAARQGPMSAGARAWLTATISRKRAARRDAAGLDAGGKTYTVDPGDSAWRIAQNLTGDGNHHFLELLAANTQIPQVGTGNQRNFKFLKVGVRLNIPPAWHVGAVTQAPPVATPGMLPAASRPAPKLAPAPSPVAAAPSAVPSALKALPSAGAPGTERDDLPAIMQAKSLLYAWEHTDGRAAAGLPDYGSQAADKSPIWSARDTLELMAFGKWANAQGASLPLSGDLTQGKLDALVAWAEKKAAGAKPGGERIPSTPAGSEAVPAPAAPIGATAPLEVIPETVISETAPRPAKPAPVVPPLKVPESDNSALWLALGAGALIVVAASDKQRRRSGKAAA